MSEGCLTDLEPCRSVCVGKGAGQTWVGGVWDCKSFGARPNDPPNCVSQHQFSPKVINSR